MVLPETYAMEYRNVGILEEWDLKDKIIKFNSSNKGGEA
jgi:hypothetical protein